MAFGYDIDFLPVGDGTRSGDAIAMRYGEPGSYVVHVVDGGTSEAGDALVNHINHHYETNYVDLVVLTHADDDHSSGLRRVLERCRVGALVMNRPWLYASEIVHLFEDQRWTVDGLTARLRKDFPIVAELEELASASGVRIYEAFAGLRLSEYFTIVAPSRERYLELIPQFSRTPQAHESAAQKSQGLLPAFQRALETAVNWVQETWDIETLGESPETSASNESSVVQFGTLDSYRVMLNGDAGVSALSEAVGQLAALGVQLPGVDFIQVPHHGSRHNVSPTILNRLLGTPVGRGAQPKSIAFASVAKEADSHPRKVVTNAFMRRGVEVHVTRGGTKRQWQNTPARTGWVASTPLSFSTAVEG